MGYGRTEMADETVEKAETTGGWGHLKASRSPTLVVANEERPEKRRRRKFPVDNTLGQTTPTLMQSGYICVRHTSSVFIYLSPASLFLN
jgi:hypothetical protein